MLLRYGRPEEVNMDGYRLRLACDKLRALVDSGMIPGFVLLVVRKSVIVIHEAYGYSSLVPDKRPMRRDTIFDIASMTKPIATATALMKLVESGEVYLRQKVSEIIPEFRGNHKEEVTIWHLLTHTSGLPAWRPLYRLGSRDKIISAICTMPLEYRPGERVVYSCLGYILLGEIIERASGASLDDYAKKNIFVPLGMNDTMFNPPEELHSRIAATEHCRWRKRLIIGEVHDENAYAMGGVSGNAGLFSTAYDLAIFAQMILNMGRYDDVRVLSPLTVELMIRNHTSELNEARGLGWIINDGKSVTSCGDLLSIGSFGHTGFTGTSIWIDPKVDLAIILLTNAVHPSREKRYHIIKARPVVHNIIASSILV